MNKDETLDELRAKATRAWDRMLTAADRLAYDVTFRADFPDSPSHSKASPELTQRLKAAYVGSKQGYDEARAEVDAHR